MSIGEKIHRYVENQKRLLELELRSEEDEADNSFVDERGGHIIRNLKMDHISVGLIGKTVVHFVSGEDENPILPTHRFAVGDEVEIVFKQIDFGDNKGKSSSSSGGVLCQITDTSISLTLYDNSNSEELYLDRLICIVPSSSTEVHKKLIKGLDELQKTGVDHEYCGKVIDAIFNPSDKHIQDNSIEFIPFNKNLDDSQKKAIGFCLGPQPITLIHGPPGTGKTTTVVELIRQAVEIHNLRVLVTAPSNQAVDNILEKLDYTMCVGIKDRHSTKKLRAVRLGHPARIHFNILKYSLESLVRQSDGTEIVQDIRQELKSFLDVTSSPKTKGIERRAAYREIKSLRKEIREREGKIISSIIGNAQIVLATNVGAASNMLEKYGKLPFDLVIIDEAAQAIEASCWIPVMRGKRLVLAGDHCQLPPTIKCKQSDVVRELSRTMFERVMYENVRVSRMLQIQYRMHESISDWSSKFMYDGKLLSHDSVRLRKLSHLSSFIQTSSDEDSILSISGNSTLLLIDTAGHELFESLDSSGSRFNEGEAMIVQKHVQNLIALGVKVEDIAVISPYNAQIELLKRLLLDVYPKLEIRSVDGFQGGEREAIVLSLVRSSERGGIDGVGFLRDNRRLNVAVTRAKRQCAVVCDSETVSQDQFLKDFLGWIEMHGEYLSSIEYSSESAQNKSIFFDHSAVKKTEVDGLDLNEVVQVKSKSQIQTQDRDQISTKDVPVEVFIDTDHISLAKELEDQLTFFAEVVNHADEELYLQFPLSESLQLKLFDLCNSLSLKCSEVKKDENGVSVVVSKCLSTSMAPECMSNFEKIKSDLYLFSKSADFDEYYDFAMTPDINIFEFERLCKDLNLLYESFPGKFVVQRRVFELDTNEVSFSPLETKFVFVPNQDKYESSVDSESTCLKHSFETQNNAEEAEDNQRKDREACSCITKSDEIHQHHLSYLQTIDSSPIEASVTINVQPSGLYSKNGNIVGSSESCHDKDDGSIDERKSTKSMSINEILGGLAQERLVRNQQSKKLNTNSKNQSKAKPGSNKSENVADMDDMAFLDMEIDKVMNSHGRQVEGTGKNYRTIINGNLLPKPKSQDMKSRDTRVVDALAKKLKDAQTARRAKPKTK